MSQPVLRTERLVLRPFRMTDVPALHLVLSDAEAMRWWDDPHPGIAATEAFVRGTMNADPARTCDFVIELAGKAIGKAGMWQRPEIGFFVAPEHQRRGYAREALGAVIPHLFATYDIPALTADVDPENIASLRLLKSLGFVEVGTRRATINIGGQWRDSVDLALARQGRAASDRRDA